MNKKAEKFKKFINDNRLQNSFRIFEQQAENRNFVIFDSSIEIKRHYLKTVVILEEGPLTIIRLWIAQNVVNERNKSRVLSKINELNTNYRNFKFFLDQKENVIMDWINSTGDESFDPNLVHFELGIIHREGKYIFSQIMEAI